MIANTMLVPDKRLRHQSFNYYIRSLVQWHDETLNCWTNIFAMAILGHMILECESNWSLYVGCLAFTTNFSSFVAHLFISRNFRVECIIFEFDLYGAVNLGTLMATTFVAYTFGSLPASNWNNPISQNLQLVLLSIRVLGSVLLVTGSSDYSRKCIKEFETSGEDAAKHVAVVKCISHSFPFCAVIMYSCAFYTAHIYPAIILTCLLVMTWLLLGACCKWPDRRWLLHSISHITGAQMVSSLLITLATDDTQHLDITSMQSTLLPFLTLDLVNICILSLFILKLHRSIRSPQQQQEQHIPKQD